MKHDYKAAIMWINTEPNAPKHFTKHGNEKARATILHALRLAQKVSEPSEGMIEEGYMAEHTLEGMGEDYPDYKQSCLNIFNAMIAQACKEVDDDFKT